MKICPIHSTFYITGVKAYSRSSISLTASLKSVNALTQTACAFIFKLIVINYGSPLPGEPEINDPTQSVIEKQLKDGLR